MTNNGEDAARTLAATALATTVLVMDHFCQALQTSTNSPPDVLAANMTWLDIYAYGSHILTMRYALEQHVNKESLETEYLSTAEHYIKTVFIPEDGAVPINQIFDIFRKMISTYQTFKGDASELLKKNVRDHFNSSKKSQVKFIDDDWWARFKLKLAIALGTGEAFMFFPETALDGLVKEAREEFARKSLELSTRFR